MNRTLIRSLPAPPMTDPGIPFAPYTQEFAANPYPVYAELRRTAPVFYSAEFDMTFLARYGDIFRALTDRRLGRSMEAGEDPAAAVADTSPSFDRYVRVNLLETEGRTHARLRRLLGGALNPRRVAGLRERIESVANELLERLSPAIAFDFIAEVAEPLPVIVIAELLGWPAGERHRLRPWAADIVRIYEKNASPGDAARAEAACGEFASMLGTLAAERRAAPRDDLISALAALQDRPDGLTEDELISSCMLLLNAGHEATVNAAGNGLRALLEHPGALERLRARPHSIQSAVEEMLRYDAPLHLFHRFALEDLTIGGHTIRKGGKIGLLYGSANRDPDMFPDADRFDIERSPNRHLAFGAATHFCLGAPLARLELQTLFRRLLAQGGTLELAEERPEYHTGLVFRGLKRLLVRFQRPPSGTGPRAV